MTPPDDAAAPEVQDIETRDAEVEEQYENYPYPKRDPEEERTRLISGHTSDLRLLDHYLFRGAKFAVQEPIRVLVAGGGTGDSAIFLAQQLDNMAKVGFPKCEVVYLDQSESARDICKGRAEVRGLDNLTYVIASLMDVPKLDLGTFDVINCLGVLHHTSDPPQGLKALKSVLKPDGGMALMVYGTYGRAGIYPLQDAIRLLTEGEPLKEKVRLSRELFPDLPRTHLIRRSLYFSQQTRVDDNEFVDMFLSPRDRSYTAAEVIGWVEDAGLSVSGFVPPRAYDPASMLDDEDLKARAAKLPKKLQWVLADHLSCAQANHSFFAVPKDREGQSVRSPGPEALPLLMTGTGEQWREACVTEKHPRIQIGAQQWVAELKPEWAPLFPLIDGRTDIATICKQVAASEAGVTESDAEAMMTEMVAQLETVCAIVLRGTRDT